MSTTSSHAQATNAKWAKCKRQNKYMPKWDSRISVDTLDRVQLYHAHYVRARPCCSQAQLSLCLWLYVQDRAALHMGLWFGQHLTWHSKEQNWTLLQPWQTKNVLLSFLSRQLWHIPVLVRCDSASANLCSKHEQEDLWRKKRTIDFSHPSMVSSVLKTTSPLTTVSRVGVTAWSDMDGSSSYLSKIKTADTTQPATSSHILLYASFLRTISVPMAMKCAFKNCRLDNTFNTFGCLLLA